MAIWSSWTHQREGPIAKAMGTKISDQDNEQMIGELRKVLVDDRHREVA
jgi:hypothetical protein